MHKRRKHINYTFLEERERERESKDGKAGPTPMKIIK